MRRGRDVACVVVTYNRKRLLVENLHALRSQTVAPSAVYLIDNASGDGTRDHLGAEGLLSEPVGSEAAASGGEAFHLGPTTILHYTRLAENTGGAGGFAAGMRRALAAGHDWVWIMDDDALPQRDALEILLRHSDDPGPPVALAGAVWGTDGRLQTEHRGRFAFDDFFPLPHRPIERSAYQEAGLNIDMASFVGLLVRGDTARRLGLPKAEFFLNHDDAEYCLRLRREGTIRLVPASRILHKDAVGGGKSVRRRVLGRVSERVPDARLWFCFFAVRNLVYLAKQYLGPLSFARQCSLYAARQVFGVLVYDRHKGPRLICVGRAMSHGLRGRFDNELPFRLAARLRSEVTRSRRST